MTDTTTPLTADEQFFYDNADYSYAQDETPEMGRVRCAKALANAERWARANEAHYEWSNDWSVGDHTKEFDCYEDGGPETCEEATLYIKGEMVASLGCVDDASREYRRVVEAELAEEAMIKRIGREGLVNESVYPSASGVRGAQ